MNEEMVRDYKILSKIDEGGMGIVYLVEHIRLGRRYALKCLKPEHTSNQHFRDRFHVEATNQAKLEHDNIVRVRDFFEDDDQYYIVMEYVDGKGLDVIIDERGKLPEIEALSIFKDVLNGLNYAHKEGVTHRDIKPSNVLIDKSGKAKIMDFGISLKAGAKRLTNVGGNVGTAWYMSPEQIKTPYDIDHRSDVYSMGILFYEMLTGDVPFDDETEFNVKLQHVEKPVPNPSVSNPEISQSLSSIILKALEKKADNRFSGCGELLDYIESYEAGTFIEFKTDIDEISQAQIDQLPSTEEEGAITAETDQVVLEQDTDDDVPEPLPTPPRQPDTYKKWALPIVVCVVLLAIAGMAHISSENAKLKKQQQIEILAAIEKRKTEEIAAREIAAREKAAREIAAREIAAREKAAREKAAREKAAREIAAREIAARNETVYLTITTKPSDARIYVDGKTVWDPSNRKIKLSTGKHEISAIRRDYIRTTEIVDWEVGGRKDLFIELKMEPTIKNYIGMDFKYISPKSYIQMGNPKGGTRKDDDELLHYVTLTKGFYMQTTEVSQRQWEKIMKYNPSEFKNCGPKCPVERVSWYDVDSFIKKLSKIDNRNYRLPTEAEWEYVCRAGSEEEYHFGNNLYNDQANFGNNNKGTVKVKSFDPNSWGFYNMHGNVNEWCQDWYGAYKLGHVIDPIGASITSNRKVTRGGAWNDKKVYCRSSNRSRVKPTVDSANNIGFRLVIMPD